MKRFGGGTTNWLRRSSAIGELWNCALTIRQLDVGSYPLCQKCVSEPSDWGPRRSVLSERQTPKVILFRESYQKGERLDRASVRPRQVCEPNGELDNSLQVFFLTTAIW